MKRRFGRHEVELVPLSGDTYAACYDVADFYPRKASEIFDAEGVRAGIEAGVRAVIIDMTQHPRLQSATIAELLKIAALLRSFGGGVALVGLGQQGRIILELLGIEGALSLHDDREAALAHARAATT